MSTLPASATHAESDPNQAPACLLVFNASDPMGAAGLAADVVASACMGAHALPVMTGAWARDSATIFDFFPLDDEAVAEQSRAVLEDVEISAIKLGFAGSPDNLGVAAGIAADYPHIPLIACMPDLSWWREDAQDAYHDAFAEMVLAQTAVLVGSYGTLKRWLLPHWSYDRAPSARDLAMAAGELGASYTLVTGIEPDPHTIDTCLSSPAALLASARMQRLPGSFVGAGDTLSAAFAALMACQFEPAAALTEALGLLEGSLQHGFRPGMGHHLPQRFFWAQAPASDPHPASSI